MADTSVLIERRPPVALLTLNRPEKYNALSIELLQRLEAVVRELGEDRSVRAVIIRGATKYFSTGMDLDDMSTIESVADTQRMLTAFRNANEAIERCPKPVIAAISGFCLTGGLELAMACDIRVSAETGRFGITSARIGSVAGAGGTQRLPRLVGAGRAKDLLFSCEFIDAQEAWRIGLVNRVVPAGQEVEAAEGMARVYAERSPLGVWFAKVAVNTGMAMPLDAALVFEAGLTAQLFTTRDKAEGMRAFLEKRSPVFEGR